MLYGAGVFVLFIGGKFMYERYSNEAPNIAASAGTCYEPANSKELVHSHGGQEEVTKKIIERVRLGEEVFDEDDDL